MCGLLGAVVLSSSLGQEVLLREGEDEVAAGTFMVPFAFYSGTLGPSIGGSIGNRGFFQPQASSFATIVGSASGSVYGFLAVRDLEIPGSERLFVNGQLNLGRFNQIDIYSDGNPNFPETRAGSSDSDADDFLTGDGTDVKVWSLFGWVLPMGEGRDDPKSRLTLRDGIVVEGARDTSTWNPFRNGFTMVGIKPFYRDQDADTDEIGDVEATTSGAEFILHHENTDFHENPSQGSIQQVRYTKDWGELGSTAPWETVDLILTKYISLGEGRTSRQRVLALDLWWIDTPSWDEVESPNGSIDHRPPSYAGATLGGTERMRGYPEGRFNDRSAVYYAAEYRHIPDWNPLRNLGWLNRRNARVQWLQYVVGLEVGQVSDEFDLGDLHSDMKVCGILGLRAMVNTLVVRADVGFSEEGAAVQMTIDHPF